MALESRQIHRLWNMHRDMCYYKVMRSNFRFASYRGNILKL